MGADAIRAFIAIELPAELRARLGEIEEQVQKHAGGAAHHAVRWVTAGNMHLTLKFLGEVSAGNVESLTRMLRAVTSQHPCFSFTVGGLGAFPNLHRPRVVWVGTQAPPDLASLQRAIEAETRKLGYPAEERPFSPHLTLGRVTQNARPEEVVQVARALGEIQVGEIGQVRVESVELFRSDLHPGGSIYTRLQHFTLNN